MKFSKALAQAQAKAKKTGVWQYLESATCQNWKNTGAYNGAAINTVVIDGDGEIDFNYSTLTPQNIDTVKQTEALGL